VAIRRITIQRQPRQVVCKILSRKYPNQKKKKKKKSSWAWWLTPIILAIQEAEIRRIAVKSQPGQIV
jgi:hypothetical protein